MTIAVGPQGIVELLQKIQRTPFQFPSGTRLNPVIEDVIRRMLIYNPKERISWEQLFKHKINFLMEEKI